MYKLQLYKKVIMDARELFLDGVEIEEDSDESELGFDNLELLKYAGGNGAESIYERRTYSLRFWKKEKVNSSGLEILPR